MGPTTVARTNALDLEEVLGRLAAQTAVAGILLMGSTGTEALTPTSDYDLVVVFAELPVPLRMVNTWVGGRLTEVYCTTVGAVERIAADPAGFAAASEEGNLAAWLRVGRIAHDRAGVLRAAQAAVLAAAPPVAATDGEVDGAWRHVGYAVAQLKRYLAADDPVSQLAVELRLLYSLSDVMVHYFTARRLPWGGEKAAIRHWAAGDPDFLARFRACLAEPDRRRKAERYEELARLAFAPVGPLWEVGTTAVAVGAGYGAGAEAPAGDAADALAFWDALVAGG
jgi:predicted nucleotidyltransferase